MTEPAAGSPAPTVLDDHRRLARRTVAMQCVLGAVIAAALVPTGRWHAVAGVVAGVLAGAIDALLLVRGLDRLPLGGVSGRAVTGGLLTRFVGVGGLVGLLLANRALSPVAVLAGFLLFPASLFAVGLHANVRGVGEVRRAAR